MHALTMCWVLLFTAVWAPRLAEGVLDDDCYQFGSGGWELIWWGDPDVRLPQGGVIPICGSGSGAVVFRWRNPQGAFLIPDERCPESFEPPYDETFKVLHDVTDSNHTGWAWTPPQALGTYWVTSQVPGACQEGVKVQVKVVGPVPPAPPPAPPHPPPPSAAAGLSWCRRCHQPALAAAVLASSIAATLLLPT